MEDPKSDDDECGSPSSASLRSSCSSGSDVVKKGSFTHKDGSLVSLFVLSVSHCYVTVLTRSVSVDLGSRVSDE